MSLDDEDSWQLATNLDRLLLDASWRRSADPLDRRVIRRWHQIMFKGLKESTPSEIGVFRGEPPLRQCGVFVRDIMPPHERVFGVSPEHVDRELGLFESELRRRLAGTDVTASVRAKAELAAWAHGEFVRIHPVTNGNGRLARLIANWVLFRLRLPCVVRLRPRPEGREYLHAACESMRDGAHSRMADWIVSRIAEESSM